MKILRSKRGILIGCAVLLLALFWVRPGANRLRMRAANSIALAIGRPVEVSSVSLRLLPQPGFDLENFVVHDDPAFSAEPMLRSAEVTAALRIGPLFRGKIEVARLDMTEPSLNLVRDREGHWNLEGLLERASKTQVAPTGKSSGEVRPRFPYIEAGNARINFKIGQEKKPIAFTAADFSFWQESENSWGMRLKAQPVHTDFNLSDTGTVLVAGTWQRAATLRETPLQFSAQWTGAQLGQVSKLVYGQDKGWRGSAGISATLAGTPADLVVQTDVSIQDFHRYDVAGGRALKLAAQCSGHYSSVDRSFSKLTCNAPVGDGKITLSGSIAAPPDLRYYDLTLAAKDVPMQALLGLARHTKKNLPDDLVATGKLDATVRLVRKEKMLPQSAWEGGGETLNFRLRWQATDTDLIFDRIPFVILSNAHPAGPKQARAAAQKTKGLQFPSGPHLEIGPFNLALGRPTPTVIHGWISSSGYGFALGGDAQVQRLLQVAHITGVPAPQLAADGTASLNLQIAGTWTGFSAPQAIGDIQLHAIHAEMRGVNAPLEIASATMHLTADETRVQDFSASLDGTAWHGSLTLSRPCAAPESCAIQFNLHADEISTGKLNQLMNPTLRKQPWYRFLTFPNASKKSWLASLHASGKLSVDKVLIHKLAAKSVSANVDLQNGKLQLTDLRGSILGGKHAGKWEADFTANPPAYSGSGSFEKVGLDQLAKAMHDGWITGTAKATYEAKASGLTAPELFSSANATLRIDARDGTLPHISLADAAGPARIRRFAGSFILSEGTLKIEQGKLQTRNSTYAVSGAASLQRVLQIKLTRAGARDFTVSGTLASPRITPTAPTPEAQAALKP